jgi:hypothetical protein
MKAHRIKVIPQTRSVDILEKHTRVHVFVEEFLEDMEFERVLKVLQWIRVQQCGGSRH